VEIEQGKAELFAAVELVDKCGPGFCQWFWLRVAQIDQVAVMREDLCRGKVTRFTVVTKGINLLVGEGFGLPLTLNAVAPMAVAFRGACSTPPAALTWAPMYLFTLLSSPG